MPIAYNINLCIADSSRNAVLLETMDGKCAWKEISQENQKLFLYATNHIAIKAMQHREPAAMGNLIISFEKIEEFMNAKTLFNEKEIEDFL